MLVTDNLWYVSFRIEIAKMLKLKNISYLINKECTQIISIKYEYNIYKYLCNLKNLRLNWNIWYCQEYNIKSLLYIIKVTLV